jgi:hypothetical protein
MMEHRRMWRRESIVLENVKIGSYISNQWNMIIAKQMQWTVMYSKWILYSSYWQHLKIKHIWGECRIWHIAIVER